MNVSPISYSNYKPASFKANRRWVKDCCGNPLYMTTTYFFRDDLDWKKLVNYLCTKYKDASRVNVLSHACSNGLEPYSFVMQLLHSKPEEAGKFFPIIAKDLNNENIYAAKIGRCGANKSDYERAQAFLDNTLWNYVNWEKSSSGENDMVLNPKSFVKEKIEFSQGDIFKDIDNLAERNNVLFCRNLWLYLAPYEQEMLLKKLASKLDKTSTLILGDYDYTNNYKFKISLKEYGFKEELKNIYSKNI